MFVGILLFSFIFVSDFLLTSLQKSQQQKRRSKKQKINKNPSPFCSLSHSCECQSSNPLQQPVESMDRVLLVWNFSKIIVIFVNFVASLQKTKQNYVVLSLPKVWTSVSQPLPQPAESVDRVLLVTTVRLRHQYPASAQWGRTAMLSMAHRCQTALTARWATTATPWDWPTSVARARQAFTVWWPVTHLHPQVSTWRGVLPLVRLIKWWYEVQAEWRFLDTAHR